MDKYVTSNSSIHRFVRRSLLTEEYNSNPIPNFYRSHLNLWKINSYIYDLLHQKYLHIFDNMNYSTLYYNVPTCRSQSPFWASRTRMSQPAWYMCVVKRQNNWNVKIENSFSCITWNSPITRSISNSCRAPALTAAPTSSFPDLS